MSNDPTFIPGTDAAESLTGTTGDDILRGEDGDDSLEMTAGNDVILGGEGTDFGIVGYSFDDVTVNLPGLEVVISHVSGETTFYEVEYLVFVDRTIEAGLFYLYENFTGIPSDASDNIAGNIGADRAWMGAGDDTVAGLAGDDTLYGEAGNDSLSGGPGKDSLFGGAGNDFIDGGPGRDILMGGEGDDTLFVGEGDDYAFGGPGNDRLVGGDGDDDLLGFEGDDTFVSSAGEDLYAGRDGTDTLIFVGINRADVSVARDFVAPNWINVTFANGEVDTADDIEFYVFEDGTFTETELLAGSESTSASVIEGTSADDSLEGTTGADTLLGLDGKDFIDGGAGDDSIDGGPGDDALFGGAGNDTIVAQDVTTNNSYEGVVAGPGNDLVISSVDIGLGISLGEGDDRLRFEGGQINSVDPGPGTDVLDLNAYTRAEVTVPTLLTFSTPLQTSNGVIEKGYWEFEFVEIDGQRLTIDDFLNPSGTGSTTRATNGDDNLTGGMLNGGWGDDTLTGTAGDDSLVDFFGVDSLSSGAGNDTIHAGLDDIVFAGIGNDLVTSNGNTTVHGGEGNDILEGHTVFGGPGDDTISPAHRDGETAHLDGGPGTDQVYINGGIANANIAADGATLIVNGARITNVEEIRFNDYRGTLRELNDRLDLGLSVPADRVEGTDAAEELRGGPDRDVVLGGGGNDTLYGRDGDDTLRGDAGNDLVYGEDGNDRIFAGPDDLGNDYFVGGAGNDVLGGGAGNDTLEGGDGSDTIFGGAGRDFLWVSDSWLFIDDDTSRNVAWGGDDGDRVRGGKGDDVLGGGGGADSIEGFEGDDTIYGGRDAGSDTIRGGADDDVIFAGDGDDSIFGGNSFSVLSNDSGNDTIYNGAGDDLVWGGKGNDLIWGGPGDDELGGGSGRDLFAFQTGNGDDTISDFWVYPTGSVGRDFLDFSAFGLTSEDDVLARATERDGGTLIVLDFSTSVLLLNVTITDLQDNPGWLA